MTSYLPALPTSYDKMLMDCQSLEMKRPMTYTHKEAYQGSQRQEIKYRDSIPVCLPTTTEYTA
jgi:hypothetical protein